MNLTSIPALAFAMGLAALGGPSGPANAFASDLPHAVGADLSFVKQQEDAGRVFKDNGAAAPALRIFRNHGFGWVRLRLFHTPTALPDTLAHTVAMARQAKALGFRFLLDLDYSDTRADPGAQTPPRAWAGLAHAPLQDSVFAYARAVLARFAAEGAVPDMVQIGNEINSGLLWPDGDSDHFGKLADLLKAGIRGVDSGAGAVARPALAAFDGLVAIPPSRAPRRLQVTGTLPWTGEAPVPCFAAPRDPVRADGRPYPGGLFPARPIPGRAPEPIPIPGTP